MQKLLKLTDVSPLLNLVAYACWRNYFISVSKTHWRPDSHHIYRSAMLMIAGCAEYRTVVAKSTQPLDRGLFVGVRWFG